MPSLAVQINKCGHREIKPFTSGGALNAQVLMFDLDQFPRLLKQHDWSLTKKIRVMMLNEIIEFNKLENFRYSK